MVLAFLTSIPILPSRQLLQRTATHCLRHRCLPSCTPFRHAVTHQYTLTTMSATEAGPLSPIKTDKAPSVVGPMPIYAQCMLRINDPVASRKFYADTLGMKELTRFDFPDFKFSLFFFAYTDATPPSQSLPQSERADWLWARPEPTIELTWNWVADTFDESMRKVSDIQTPEEVYVNGNADGEPKGFGYVEISVSDVDAALSSVDTESIIQKSTPVSDDPSLTDAVVRDPDGYHIRIIGKADGCGSGSKSLAATDPVFSSVMLRVKDPRTAVPFFSRLGFNVVASGDVGGERASEWYMGVSEKQGDASWARSKLRACTVTLRHEWGTESSEEQIYTNGNVKPYRGFGHVGMIVDDIYETSKTMEELGYKIVRKPSPFADVGEIAFVAEPSTGYWVELIKRAGDRPSAAYEQPVF